MAALAITGVAIGIAALREPGPESDACAAASRLSGVWDHAVRARLARHFGETASWHAISRALDSYTGQWIPLQEGACRSGAELAQKCLDERLAALQDLLVRSAR